jgi:methyl-accepting chemotaxis protein
MDKTTWAIIGLLALVTLSNVGLEVMLAKSLRASLGDILRKLEPLKAGDLTQRLPTNSSDELAQIATGVNAFIEQLQAIVQRARDRAEHLAGAATQLSATSANLLQISGAQSGATTSVAAAVEQFSVSIDQVADNASSAERIAGTSRQVSERGGTEVRSAVAEIRNIEQAVNEAAHQMESLGRQARDISGIVNVIKDVAEQTNLLALNAAIEAARAGESGRGFAVVADEVRKLAERTSASAEEITGMVAAIQKNTEAASEVMQRGNQMVAEGVRQVVQAGGSMQNINEGSSNVLGAVSDISMALREQRAAGTEIAKNVEKIAQMTEESRNTASDVSSAAHDLEGLAGELRQEVARFRA